MRRALVGMVVALFLVTLAASPVHARPNEWHVIAYHTVSPGETLFSIGRLYGVSPWAIASYNGIVNPNLIYPWQVLAIPSAYVGGWHPGFGYPCMCSHFHTVTAGENLFRISLHYGVSMWHIAQCNNILNLNYIQWGHTLCIP